MSQSNSSSDEIQRLAGILERASALMASQVRPEDVVIFLGTTKAGKSTLINFLLGNELVGERVQRFLPVTIRKLNSCEGPAIGVGCTSETIVPTRWDNVQRLPNLVLWDAPGFEDNRGPIQDITNAYYIYELFKNIRSIRIVLVVDFSNIADNFINPFLSQLSSVEKLLRSKMSSCFGSIIVAFSKVPETHYDNLVDARYICTMLDYKILQNSTIDMSMACRDLIKHLTHNSQQIGLFKIAKVGRIGQEVDGGVSEAILNAQSVSSDVLREVVCPSLCDKSQSFLFKARTSISSMDSFQELLKVAQSVFEERLSRYMQQQEGAVSDDHLHGIRAELIVLLNEVKRALDPENSFQLKINQLQMIDPRIESKITADCLLEKSRMMVFIDRLLDLEESKEFDIYVEGILMNAHSEVEKMVFAIEKRLGEISQMEYERKMETTQHQYQEEIQGLKTQLNEVKQHNEQRARKLGFFQKVGVFLDSACCIS